MVVGEATSPFADGTPETSKTPMCWHGRRVVQPFHATSVVVSVAVVAEILVIDGGGEVGYTGSPESRHYVRRRSYEAVATE
jgi:hypothetical protein